MMKKTALSFGVSILSVLAMFLLSHLLWEPVTSRVPFVFFWLAVAAAAWYGGYWPGIFSCLLSGVAVSYLFVRDGKAFQLEAFEIVGMVVFLLGSIMISSISGAERRRRKWFETTLSSIGDAVIATGTDGRIRFINKRAESLTEWAQAEVLGKPLEQVFVISDEKTQKPLETLARQVIERQQAMGARTAALISRTGRRFTIEQNASPVRDEKGVLIGAVIVFRDIEQRTTTERMLTRSEEALRLALDAGEMGVWDWNMVSGEVKWTGALEKIHGLEEGTFDGTMETFQKLIHPDDLPKVQADIENALATGSRFSTEFRRIFRDQTVHWIGGEGKPFYDETGKPIRMIGVGLDLTPKKIAEQKSAFLAEASRLLSTTLDYETTLQNIASLIVPDLADWCYVDLLDDDGKLKTVAFHLTDPKMLEIAKQLQQRYPPDSNSKYGPINVVKSNRSEMMSEIPDQVLVEIAQDQDHLQMLRQLDLKSYVCVPLFARGRTLGSITFIFSHSGRRYTKEDLTLAEDLGRRAALAIDNARLYRQSELDKEVIAAQLRERDVLMREIYHRAKNNLQIISSLLKLQSNFADDTSRSVLNETQNRIQSMAMIHERLYRSQSLSELDLGLYVKDLAEMLYASLSHEKARIELRIDCENIAVDINKAIPCGLILNELITNSMKHAFPSGESGEIRVALDRQNGRFRLQVSDNGIGLPEEIDWQNNNSLGLRIVTLLVKQLSGQVRIDRTSGTSFSIEF